MLGRAVIATTLLFLAACAAPPAATVDADPPAAAAPAPEPAPAVGQSCFPRALVAGRLAIAFRELPVSIGLTNDGTLVEVFASAAGTFTIVETDPRGVACIVSSGTSWEGPAGPAPGEES